MNKIVMSLSWFIVFPALMAMERCIYKEAEGDSAHATTSTREHSITQSLTLNETPPIPQSQSSKRRSSLLESPSEKRGRREKPNDRDELSSTESSDDDNENALQEKLFYAVKERSTIAVQTSRPTGSHVISAPVVGEALLSSAADISAQALRQSSVFVAQSSEVAEPGSVIDDLLRNEARELEGPLTIEPSFFGDSGDVIITNPAALNALSAPVTQTVKGDNSNAQISLKDRLFAAAFSNDVSELQKLLGQGASYNWVQNGITLLHAACMDKYCFEMVQWLVQNYPALADRVTEQDNSNILHMAAERGYFDMLIWLIEKCPHLVEKVDFNERSLFDRAVLKGNLQIAQYLAEIYPQFLHRRNQTGDSVLHVALLGSNVDTIEWLAQEYPFLLNIKNNAQQTPYDAALRLQQCAYYAEIVRVAQEKHFKSSTLHSKAPWGSLVERQQADETQLKHKLFLATAKGDLGQIQDLLAQGASAHWVLNGVTLVHLAASKNHIHVVKRLVQAYPNLIFINSIDRNETPLHIAASQGDGTVLLWLIEQFPELVEKSDTSGRSILSNAILTGDYSLVRNIAVIYPQLIERKDNDGNTVLHLALQTHNDSIARWLAVEYPLLLFVTNNAQELPFDLARRLGSGCVATLRDAQERHFKTSAGAIPNQQTTLLGSTVQTDLANKLFAAAFTGNLHELQSLIALRAPHDGIRFHGLTLLHAAAYRNRRDVVEWLARTYPALAITGATPVVDSRIRPHSVFKGDTVAHIAAMRGHKDILISLIQQYHQFKSLLNEKQISIFGSTILNGHLELAQYLAHMYPHYIYAEAQASRLSFYYYKQNYPLNDAEGPSPLFLAIRSGSIPMVEWLLKTYTRLKWVDAYGHTILHWAAASSFPMLQYIIGQCEDLIYARNAYGSTLLHLAILPCGTSNWRPEHYNKISWIAEHYSLLLSIRNDTQETPYDEALRFKQFANAAILRLAQEKYSKPVALGLPGTAATQAVAVQGYMAAVPVSSATRPSLQLGLMGYFDVHKRIDSKTRFRISLLQNTAIVQHLLDKGGDINVQDEEGNSALMKAIEAKHDELIRLLMAKEANLNIQNNAGETALILAAKQGSLPIVTLLIEKGADTKVQDMSGQNFSAYLDPAIQGLIAVLLAQRS